MPTTITPQDYTAFLAMIKHEGENGIANLLKQGRDGDALGYVAGLIDTWTNRASASGLQPWQMMNRPYQITDWDSSTSAIQTKANSLPSNIKQLADAYLSARAEGAPQLNPGVNFYLNKDLVEATPAYGTKWKNWYDQSSVVNAFGDQRGGGRGSLQTQFVANPNEYQAKDTGIVFDKSLKVQPTDYGQGAYAKITGTASMGYDPARALNTGTTGLNTFDASEGAGPISPGMVSDLGRAYETGNPFGFSGTDTSSGVGPGFNTLGGATPYGDVNPLAFGTGVNAGGGRPGAFNDFLPPTETGDPFGFTGLNAGAGTGNGSFGNGVSPYGQPPGPNDFSNTNVSGGVGPGLLAPTGLTTTPQTDTASTIGAPAASGGLPPFFSPVDYVNANPDLAAAGITPQTAAQHYLNYGQFETRALAPWLEASVHAAPGGSSTIGSPGLTSTLGPSTTPTLGSGSTASTIGAPNAISGLPPGFDAQAYALANPDVAASGQDPTQHFLNWGRFDVRALAPGQEASVHAAPGTISPYGGTVQASTLGPFGTTPTIGPDGLVNVMSTGLTPTQGPSGLTSTQGPGSTVQSFSPTGGSDFLTMPSTTATTIGAPDASSALPAFFSPVDYVNANPDLAAAGITPATATQHFLDYGRFETRALAPWLQAQVHAAPGLSPTLGPSTTANTIGPGALTPTLDTASQVSTLGPPALTGTYGAPTLTPTLNPTTTTPSWSPFGGAGVTSPYGFSGSNVGGGLGAGPQTFGSYYPVGSGGTDTAPTSSGPDMSNPFGFTNMDVSGFDPNAYGGGGGGGSSVDLNFGSGFDEAGAMRNVLAQQAEALRLKDLAVKTPMHTDPNAFNAVLANGGNAVGFGTPLQNPGAIQTPIVPNLTTQNLVMGSPGGMFATFAPWR